MGHRSLFLVGCVLLWSSHGLADEEDRPSPSVTQAAETNSETVQLTPDAQEDLVAQQAAHWNRQRKEGRRNYVNGNYENAAKIFESLHRSSGDPDLLYDLGMTYKQLRDWPRCAGYFGRYVSEALQSPKRDRAANEQQSCQARGEASQMVHIDTVPPGASVYFSNRTTPIQGQTPFKAQRPVGVDRVWLELDGYEPMLADIEVRRDEVFRLKLALKKRVETGWLFVDSNIRDAQVYVDGRPLMLTPFSRPQPIGPGAHQIQVKRDGFTPFSTYVDVEPFLMQKVDVVMERSGGVGTWRSSVGWTSASLGLLAMIGGGVSTHLANQEYNDTPQFDQWVGYERLGYGVGTSLLTTGIALLIWDAFGENILDSDRNPHYGDPVETPDPLSRDEMRRSMER